MRFGAVRACLLAETAAARRVHAVASSAHRWRATGGNTHGPSLLYTRARRRAARTSPPRRPSACVVPTTLSDGMSASHAGMRCAERCSFPAAAALAVVIASSDRLPTATAAALASSSHLLAPQPRPAAPPSRPHTLLVATLERAGFWISLAPRGLIIWGRRGATEFYKIAMPYMCGGNSGCRATHPQTSY